MLCGNPLTPPTEYPPNYTGKSWSWFNKNSLTVVTQNVTIIDIFILVDAKTGQTYLRPRGTTGAQDTLQTPTTTTPPTTRSTPSTTRPPSTTDPPTTPPTTGSTTSTTHTPST